MVKTTTTLQQVIGQLQPRPVALTMLHDFKGFSSARRHKLLLAALELGVESGLIGRQVVEGGQFGYFMEKGEKKEGFGYHVENIKVGTTRTQVVKVKRSFRIKAKKQR